VKIWHQLVCVPQQNPPRSGLWTTSPSLFVFPSLFIALCPLFPLHPRNAPVTPLFPLHPQKHGGRGVSLLTSFASLTSSASFPSSFPLATNSNHSRTIGNCCPTSRTRSNIYHYITYPCRRADNFASATDHGKSAIPGSSRNALFQLSTVNCRP
jgi:hypothetical protein